MTVARLKQLSQILIEVSGAYDSLNEKRKNTSDKTQLKEIELKLNTLRSQVTYLLAGIKKTVHTNG
jgi:hypothetical protein